MSESSVATDGAHIAAASLDGVGIIDGTQYIYANDTLAHIHGHEKSQELVGHRWEELYSPVDPALTAHDLLSRTRDTGQWRGRATGRTQHGDRVPVELSLRRAENGVVCVARDITERKEREREIERYETILDTVDDGVYVLNEDLRVDVANERFFELLAQFGFSREEVREMHAHDLVVNEDERAALEAEIERAIERDSHIGSFETSAELPDGDRVVCESRFRLYPEPEYRGPDEIREALDWALENIVEQPGLTTRNMWTDGETFAVEVDTYHTMKDGTDAEFPQVFIIESEHGQATRWQSYLPFPPSADE